MSSLTLFENQTDSFIQRCKSDLFNDLYCIFGELGFFISVIIIILNIFALVKMIKYYGQINFETALLCLSIIQVILLVATIMHPFIILFSIFYTIQIFIISLIIKQFIDLLKRPKNFIEENLSFIIINSLNILITTFFVLFNFEIIKIDEKYILYYQLLFPLLYFICTLILTNYCISIINILQKIKNRKSFCLLVTKKSGISNKNASNLITIDQRDWIFFAMRKKQIKPLFIINLVCSLIQIIFMILNIIFFEINSSKIIPDSNYGIIIYYVYLVICFFIVSVNFLCFYWLIRKQYLCDEERLSKQKKKKLKKILDDNDIRRETISNLVENSKDVTDFIDENNIQKKYKKSVYANNFSDLDEEGEYDDFFLKPKDDKNIQLIDKKNNNAESINVNVINKINEDNISESVLDNDNK